MVNRHDFCWLQKFAVVLRLIKRNSIALFAVCTMLFYQVRWTVSEKHIWSRKRTDLAGWCSVYW